METPSMSSRMPSLDGIRALAISLVIASHLASDGGRMKPLQLGGLGVQIFFVLSGFLITSILLRELDRNGRISLRRFYFRRALRIFPAFYTFVGLVVLLSATGIARIDYGHALAAVTYTSDYIPTGSYALFHTWSLSIEEQFYLLWPAIILFGGRRSSVAIALAVIVVCPLLRVADAVFSQHLFATNPQAYRFDTQADALAAGCLLAFLAPTIGRTPALSRAVTSRFLVVAPVFALLIAEAHAMSSSPVVTAAYLALGFTVTNFAIAACIYWGISERPGLAFRVLNWRPVMWIGLISYSLYLWQQIFLNPHANLFPGHPELRVGAALVAATASFYLVERSGLALRERVESRVLVGRVRAPSIRALESTDPG